ncbi:hypothetical protein MN116_000888 [Schistosoma mekongi]|uniref:Uncharacterized protein n=1 Tax=Schistosoma mekongi TaxID=38744 RepID=A0AAE2D8X8_SCHME|nr:hypothetical protein MN116_000888 [Schistosoma mekongi]
MQEVNNLKLLPNSNYFHYLEDLNKLNNDNKAYLMNKSILSSNDNVDNVNKDSFVPLSPSIYIDSVKFCKETLKYDQSSSLLSPSIEHSTSQSIQSYLMNTVLWNTLNLDQFKQLYPNSNEQSMHELNSSQAIHMDTIKDFTNYHSIKRQKLNEQYALDSLYAQYMHLNNDNKKECHLEKRRHQGVHDQYESQPSTSANCKINLSINTSTNNDNEEEVKSSPIKYSTDGKPINQFICPVCQSEIETDELENHFNYEFKKMQNFTIKFVYINHSFYNILIKESLYCICRFHLTGI